MNWIRDRRTHLCLGPLLALLATMIPTTVSPEAHRLACLMILVITWWILEVLPLAVTGLLGCALAVVLGIAPASEAFLGYAHPLVFLFMGGFFIARSMTVHGLDRRISLFLLTRKAIAGHPWRMIVTLILCSAFLAMWISNTATTAMLLPISLGVIGVIFPLNHRAQGSVLLSIAYASSIGGITTPIGSTPNLIGMGLLDRLLDKQVSFFEWVALCAPITTICLGALILLTWLDLPSMKEKVESGYLKKEFRSLGSLTLGEKQTIVVALLAAGLWILPGILQLFEFREFRSATIWMKSHLSEAIVAVVASSLLFILPSDRSKWTPTLSWKNAREIDWNSLLLFGSGISLGKMMFETGLASTLGRQLVSFSGNGESFWIFVACATLFAIFFTETTSNTATANMMIPLIIASAAQAGFSGFIPTIAVTVACSLAFMLPVSTPPNAIVFGSGRVHLRDMIRRGWKMNLVGATTILFVLFIF